MSNKLVRIFLSPTFGWSWANCEITNFWQLCKCRAPGKMTLYQYPKWRYWYCCYEWYLYSCGISCFQINLWYRRRRHNLCDVQFYRKFGKSEKEQQHKIPNGVSQDADKQLQAADRGGNFVSASVDGFHGRDSPRREETVIPCATSTAASPLNHDSHD